MYKLGEFIKQHLRELIYILIVILFAVIGVPLIINWLYEQPAVIDFFAVEWEAKDALSFYGDVLAFLGTVVFSGLALWQNHIIKESDDKHTLLLERMEKEKNAPYIVIDGVVSSGNAKKITFSLKNLSENIAQDVMILNAKIENPDGTICWTDSKTYSTAYIDSKKDFRIDISTPGVTDEKQRFLFEVVLYDIFGEIHEYTAVGSFIKHKNCPTFALKKKKCE